VRRYLLPEQRTDVTYGIGTSTPQSTKVEEKEQNSEEECYRESKNRRLISITCACHVSHRNLWGNGKLITYNVVTSMGGSRITKATTNYLIILLQT
jgi:hypothetical protein